MCRCVCVCGCVCVGVWMCVGVCGACIIVIIMAVVMSIYCVGLAGQVWGQGIIPGVHYHLEGVGELSELPPTRGECSPQHTKGGGGVGCGREV